MTKEAVISKLGAFPQQAPKMLVTDDEQDVPSIIDCIIQKHKECVKHYDVLYSLFDASGSWRRVAERLFNFCKQNMAYRVDSVKWQYVDTPRRLMTKGYCDCKGYALFIGGILDAMLRAGESIKWVYRFASYKLLDRTPGHVFVVIDPGTSSEIWIDPVLDRLDQRRPRPIYTQDVKVTTSRSMGGKMAGIGFIPGTGLNVKAKTCGGCIGSPARIGISKTEQTLLDSVKQYSDGVSNAIVTAQGSGVLNSICLLVIATASIEIPLIAAIFTAIKLGSIAVSDVFGAGSLAARLMNDIATNPITAPVTLVESLFSGRTFESDQYRAAQFYEFYVQGNASATALNKIPDSAVVPALKWFVDRLGVFISGAEHILGLIESPAAYLAYYGVNNYTTTDTNRVNAASNVASGYFIQNGIAGSWASTVGVYDMWIATVAQQEQESEEQVAAQVNYTDVYSSAATTGPNQVTQTPVAPQVPVIPIALGLAALVILLPSQKKATNAK